MGLSRNLRARILLVRQGLGSLRIQVLRKIFVLLPMAWRIRLMRAEGVQIGEDCLIHTPYFSVEPYLIKIGNRVAISSGTEFITHDASGWIFPDRPDLGGIYAPIEIGDNVYIGMNCMLLPGTVIGSSCVIGAGSVVRGTIPDNSVVMGNPATIVMKTSMLMRLLDISDKKVETSHLDLEGRRKVLTQHFRLASGNP